MSRFAVLPARAFEDSRLSLSHLKALGIICTHTDKNGWAWPSVSRIAAVIGVSRQRTSKCIQEMKEWGYLEVRSQKRKTDGGQTSNLYRVIMDHGDPVAPPATSEVAPPATSEVAPPATSEIAPRTYPKEQTQRTTTPPTPPAGEGVDFDVEEVVQAELWEVEQAGRTIGPGLEAHIRKRLVANGLTDRDQASLEAFRQHKQRRQEMFSLPALPDPKPGEKFERQREMMRAALVQSA